MTNTTDLYPIFILVALAITFLLPKVMTVLEHEIRWYIQHKIGMHAVKNPSCNHPSDKIPRNKGRDHWTNAKEKELRIWREKQFVKERQEKPVDGSKFHFGHTSCPSAKTASNFDNLRKSLRISRAKPKALDKCVDTNDLMFDIVHNKRNRIF